MARKLIALVVLAACKQSPATPPPSEPTAEEAPVFKVDVTPPTTCAAKSPCEARIVLTALDGFKVNKEYPFKFVADANPAIAYDGTGTFAHGDPKTGTLTIKFTPDAPGTAKVTGKFKLSVCTDDVCKIEQPSVAFDVPVT
jgi:hypothetical protein